MSLSGFSDHFRSSFPTVVGGRVLIAVSGGADSVCLLHLLGEPALGIRRDAAYVDHGTRPDEVAAEIEACRALCAAEKVPFHVLALPPRSTATHGREAEWRVQRYAALHDLAAQLQIPTIATGHHRDDVAEGVLVQLLRGAGPKALNGIAQLTPEGIIRPLLPWSRQALKQWLLDRSIPWCEDSSNLSPEHLRNRVRHQVLPGLEAVSPRLRDHLVNLAAALAEDEDHLAGELRRRTQWIDPWHPDGGVPVASVAELTTALRTRWLHAQARRIGLSRVSRRQLELVHSLLRTGEPRSVTLGERWCLRSASGSLWLEPPELPSSYCHDLLDGSSVALTIPGWFAALRPVADHRPAAVGWSWIPPEGGCLSVRSIREGEVLRVRQRAFRVSALLAEKLPRHLRRAWPLVCVDDTISWIPGVWEEMQAGSRRRQTVEVFRR